MSNEHKDGVKRIDAAFYRMQGVCEHTHDWDRYIAFVEEEEREHRRFKPVGLSCGLTTKQSIRLFAVKEVFERFVPAHEGEKIWTPEAKDFLHVKKSVFAACAIADICQEEILKEFRKPEMVDWLATVDYCKLNKATRLETLNTLS